MRSDNQPEMGFRCQQCGSTLTVHADRTTYVCDGCHAAFTDTCDRCGQPYREPASEREASERQDDDGAPIVEGRLGLCGTCVEVGQPG